MKRDFPNAVSYNRFVEPEQRVFLKLVFLLKLFDSLFDDGTQLVHSIHRSITNFPVNLVAALSAYCFFENKPDALQGYYIEDSQQ